MPPRPGNASGAGHGKGSAAGSAARKKATAKTAAATLTTAALGAVLADALARAGEAADAQAVGAAVASAACTYGARLPRVVLEDIVLLLEEATRPTAVPDEPASDSDENETFRSGSPPTTALAAAMALGCLGAASALLSGQPAVDAARVLTSVCMPLLRAATPGPVVSAAATLADRAAQHLDGTGGADAPNSQQSALLLDLCAASVVAALPLASPPVVYPPHPPIATPGLFKASGVAVAAVPPPQPPFHLVHFLSDFAWPPSESLLSPLAACALVSAIIPTGRQLPPSMVGPASRLVRPLLSLARDAALCGDQEGRFNDAALATLAGAATAAVHPSIRAAGPGGRKDGYAIALSLLRTPFGDRSPAARLTALRLLAAAGASAGDAAGTELWVRVCRPLLTLAAPAAVGTVGPGPQAALDVALRFAPALLMGDSDGPAVDAAIAAAEWPLVDRGDDDGDDITSTTPPRHDPLLWSLLLGGVSARSPPASIKQARHVLGESLGGRGADPSSPWHHWCSLHDGGDDFGAHLAASAWPSRAEAVHPHGLGARLPPPWMASLWSRGLRHDNPQARRAALAALCTRTWGDAGGGSHLPMSFLLGPLMDAACDASLTAGAAAALPDLFVSLAKALPKSPGPSVGAAVMGQLAAMAQGVDRPPPGRSGLSVLCACVACLAESECDPAANDPAIVLAASRVVVVAVRAEHGGAFRGVLWPLVLRAAAALTPHAAVSSPHHAGRLLADFPRELMQPRPGGGGLHALATAWLCPPPAAGYVASAPPGLANTLLPLVAAFCADGDSPRDGSWPSWGAEADHLVSLANTVVDPAARLAVTETLAAAATRPLVRAYAPCAGVALRPLLLLCAVFREAALGGGSAAAAAAVGDGLDTVWAARTADAGLTVGTPPPRSWLAAASLSLSRSIAATLGERTEAAIQAAFPSVDGGSPESSDDDNGDGGDSGDSAPTAVEPSDDVRMYRGVTGDPEVTESSRRLRVGHRHTRRRPHESHGIMLASPLPPQPGPSSHMGITADVDSSWPAAEVSLRALVDCAMAEAAAAVRGDIGDATTTPGASPDRWEAITRAAAPLWRCLCAVTVHARSRQSPHRMAALHAMGLALAGLAALRTAAGAAGDDPSGALTGLWTCAGDAGDAAAADAALNDACIALLPVGHEETCHSCPVPLCPSAVAACWRSGARCSSIDSLHAQAGPRPTASSLRWRAVAALLRLTAPDAPPPPPMTTEAAQRDNDGASDESDGQERLYRKPVVPTPGIVPSLGGLTWRLPAAAAGALLACGVTDMVTTGEPHLPPVLRCVRALTTRCLAQHAAMATAASLLAVGRTNNNGDDDETGDDDTAAWDDASVVPPRGSWETDDSFVDAAAVAGVVARAAWRALRDAPRRRLETTSLLIATALHPGLFGRPAVTLHARGAPLARFARRAVMLGRKAPRVSRCVATHLAGLWAAFPVCALFYTPLALGLLLQGATENKTCGGAHCGGSGDAEAADELTASPGAAAEHRAAPVVPLLFGSDGVTPAGPLSAGLAASHAFPRVAVMCGVHECAAIAGLTYRGAETQLTSSSRHDDGDDDDGGDDPGRYILARPENKGLSMPPDPAARASSAAVFGRALLTSLLSRCIADAAQTLEGYRRGTGQHRHRLRAWQAMCALAPFADTREAGDAAVEAAWPLVTGSANLGSVRAYQETFLTLIGLRWPASVLPRVLNGLRRVDGALPAPALSSLVLIAGLYLLRCSPPQRRQWLAPLTAAIFPWATSYSHSLRCPAQVVLSRLLADYPLGSAVWGLPTAPGSLDGLVATSLAAMMTTNADTRKLASSLGPMLDRFDPATATSPRGIFAAAGPSAGVDPDLAAEDGLPFPLEGAPPALVDALASLLAASKAAHVESRNQVDAAQRNRDARIGASVTVAARPPPVVEDDEAATAAAGAAVGFVQRKRASPVWAAVSGGGASLAVTAPLLGLVWPMAGGDADADAELDRLLASGERTRARALADGGSGGAPRSGLVVLATYVDKAPNLGGIARTCEVFRCESLVVPDAAVASSSDFMAVSLGAERWLPMAAVPPDDDQVLRYLRAMQAAGYALIGLEQTPTSTPLHTFRWPTNGRAVLVLGREKEGVPPAVLALLDSCVEIPQAGMLRSLNVHVSAALAVWTYETATRLQKKVARC